MLQRLRYRRVLPIANLLLYLLLVGYGDWSLVQTVRLYRDVDPARGGAEDALWDPIYIDRAIPLSKVLATGINFPAVLFAIPFGTFQRGWRAELLIDGVAAIYLLPLWYAVGRWIDLRSSERVRSGTVLLVVRRVTLVFACVAGLGMLVLLLVGLARRSGEWSVFLLSLPALFWPAFLAYVAHWELRAARTRAVEASAH